MNKKWLLVAPRQTVRTDYDSIFVGPCNIKINELELGLTLESTPTKIGIKKTVLEIKPSCKGGAVSKTVTKLTEITAETSILYNADLYEKLVRETGFDFNEDFKTLEDVNVKFKSDEEIELMRCNVKFEKNINFKKNTVSEIKLIITALKTDYGYYKIGGNY